jgi:hypothetical protein
MDVRKGRERALEIKATAMEMLTVEELLEHGPMAMDISTSTTPNPSSPPHAYPTGTSPMSATTGAYASYPTSTHTVTSSPPSSDRSRAPRATPADAADTSATKTTKTTKAKKANSTSSAKRVKR